jgi:signal peptidase I
VSGLLLIAAAAASVSAMVIVMTQHLGFAPVLSPSMEPTFHPGDLVITRPEPATDVKVGQVIALPVPDAPSQRYVHRVISVEMKEGRPLVRTKGDANPAPETFSLRIDSPTVPRVVTTVPYLGRLSVLLQHSTLRLTVMAVTVIAILIAAWRMLVGPARTRGKHA